MLLPTQKLLVNVVCSDSCVAASMHIFKIHIFA